MLLAIDKPTWITSYDVIRRLKHLYPKQKIWHSGTLDPLATWLLIIWVWAWTKQLFTVQWLDKTYQTTIDFAKMSDTRDTEYREKYEEYKVKNIDWIIWIEKNWVFVPAPTKQEIEKIIKPLTPEYNLPLTLFSAKKKDWKKLYELARSGQALTENAVMKIFSIEILDYNFPLLELKIHVGSWTYIRSIWYWIGQQLGLGGILTKLRRNSVWKYDLWNMKLEKLWDTDLMWIDLLQE